MDPILIAIAIVLAAATAVTLGCWHKLLAWGQDSVIPWLRRKNPSLADLASQAFVALDKVVVAIHQVVRQSWQKLRETLLQEVLLLRREASGSWLKVVTSWLVDTLESASPTVVKHVTTERISWYDLPDDVREASLRWEKNEKELDLTKLRDDELIAMTN